MYAGNLITLGPVTNERPARRDLIEMFFFPSLSPRIPILIITVQPLGKVDVLQCFHLCEVAPSPVLLLYLFPTLFDLIVSYAFVGYTSKARICCAVDPLNPYKCQNEKTICSPLQTFVADKRWSLRERLSFSNMIVVTRLRSLTPLENLLYGASLSSLTTLEVFNLAFRSLYHIDNILEVINEYYTYT